MMTATVTWWPELEMCERCDRCGLHAQLRAVFAPTLELLFCGHHGRQHLEKLLELDIHLYRSPEFE
jgi:hypothetical protein